MLTLLFLVGLSNSRPECLIRTGAIARRNPQSSFSMRIGVNARSNSHPYFSGASCKSSTSFMVNYSLVVWNALYPFVYYAYFYFLSIFFYFILSFILLLFFKYKYIFFSFIFPILCHFAYFNIFKIQKNIFLYFF